MNKCDNCGRFRKLKDLHTYGADNGSVSVEGQECTGCLSPFDRERLGLSEEESNG